MKNMIKRLFSLVLLFTTLFLLVSCVNPVHSNKKTIVTTIFPHYSFTKEIVGDRWNVEVLLKPGQDSHNFDPSVSTVLSINRADIFVYTADEMEPWASKLIENLEGKGPVIVNASKGIDLCLVSEEDHEHEDGSEHDPEHHHTYDPHIWTSIKNSIIMVKNILTSICALDPDNANYYRANAEAYIAKLNLLDDDFRSVIDSAKNKKLFFVCPFALYYFVKDYGLEFESLYSTCSTEVEPTAKELIHFIEEIKEHNINYIFNKELMSNDIPNKVAEETKTEILVLHSGNNISLKEYRNGVTYYDILKQNLEVLKKGLN